MILLFKKPDELLANPSVLLSLWDLALALVHLLILFLSFQGGTVYFLKDQHFFRNQLDPHVDTTRGL